MLEFINQINTPLSNSINDNIRLKKYDRPLIEYIIDSFKSLNIIDNYKLIHVEIRHADYDIDNSKYNWRRDRHINKSIKYIDDSIYDVLDLYFQISGPSSKSNKMETVVVKRSIFLPIIRDGILYSKGSAYNLIYQLVDKTYYPTTNCVVIKSLMPICIKITSHKLIDINNIEYNSYYYNLQLFKTMISVLVPYLYYGIDFMLNFLEVDRVIDFHPKNIYTDDPNYLYFPVNNSIIRVYKKAFDQFIYVKSVVSMLYILMDDNFLEYNTISNRNELCKIFTLNGTSEESMLIFHKRLYDETTKKELFLDKDNKDSIYSIIRWVIQNFIELWEIDNLNIYNKRLRCNEYLASFITKELSKKLNRPTILGNRATIDDYIKMVNFNSDLIIKKIYSSGLLKYDDCNNDSTFSSGFKYTKKGPNSLGNITSRSVNKSQRDLHYSMISNIDITNCSISDPGQSGEITPFSELNCLAFNPNLETNNFRNEWYKFLNNEFGNDDDNLFVYNFTDNEDLIRKTDKLAEINNSIKYQIIIKPGTKLII